MLFFYKQMKKTGTNAIEKKIVDLYNKSVGKVDKESIKAQTTIDKILKVFKLISIYDENNHKEIVRILYFSKENILIIGVRKIAARLFMDDKTLYKYRKKYCAVISNILNSI